MSEVNPRLREQFENLPIKVKDEILESGVIIKTEEDLRRCLEQLEQRERCCGDL